MSATLHAPYCADHAIQRTVPIVENVRLARDTYRVRFDFPELAERITPGQFLMLRLAGGSDPLLGRPLALYNTVTDEAGRPRYVDVVYLVKGRLTTRLAEALPGQKLDVWGPLGNGFPLQNTNHLIMVAGGIGQTPFLALAAEHLGTRRYGSPQRVVAGMPKVTFCYGARNAGYLAGIEDFERLGVDVRIATDDGSRGHRGFVTDLLRQVLAEAAQVPASGPRIVCCGPEVMMERVAAIAAESNVPCQVSLETPMACGIGICFTCVAKVKDADGGWDYKRTCVEGPIFDAAKIEW
ncbi:MAG: dihydroorotate dehydrogenase electron transfer subunit [Pirellulales bacterium]